MFDFIIKLSILEFILGCCLSLKIRNRTESKIFGLSVWFRAELIGISTRNKKYRKFRLFGIFLFRFLTFEIFKKFSIFVFDNFDIFSIFDSFSVSSQLYLEPTTLIVTKLDNFGKSSKTDLYDISVKNIGIDIIDQSIKSNL